MDQQVAVIGQDPVGLVVAFHAEGQLARLPLQAKIHFVADGLHLLLVRARADDKEVRERTDPG